jgi:hypothetical protein
MKPTLASLTLTTTLCSGAACGPANPHPNEPTNVRASEARAAIDLRDPGQNLEAFVRVRASLDPEQEVVFYWTGSIYSFVKEDTFPPARGTNTVLFSFEGFNVARAVKTADGYELWTREASFYEDPATGKILDCWHNPLNNTDLPVVHVWNDQVNFRWKASTWAPIASTELGDRVIFSSDVLLAYPSPLPVADYPDYSAGNVYQGDELFNFFVARAELEDTSRKLVPADISWVRLGQYVPFMKMGTTQGNLLYSTRGAKLLNGWNDLPAKVRQYVTAHHPEFQHAPSSWPADKRNTTSFTYFRDLVKTGNYTPRCTP